MARKLTARELSQMSTAQRAHCTQMDVAGGLNAVVLIGTAIGCYCIGWQFIGVGLVLNVLVSIGCPSTPRT